MPHWSLPRAAASVQLMVRLAEELGVAAERCTAGTDLHPDALTNPALEVDGQQELGVLRNILRALDPSVAFALMAGQRYHLTTHGMWGMAVICSPDLRSAIEVTQRYSDLSYSFNRLGFEIRGSQARFLYDDADNPEDVRAALVERDMAALVTFGRDYANRMIPIQSLQLRGARPPHAAAFEPLFGVAPQYRSAVNCVAIDVAYLDLRPPMADELGLRVCEEACRNLLERRGTRAGIAGKVSRRLLSQPGEFPSMEIVAASLGMSTRTLRNQLSREGTSYRDLLEELRERMAEELLASRMTVDQVAQRLGYADTSSFITAFKRWKGVAPGGYRHERLGG